MPVRPAEAADRASIHALLSRAAGDVPTAPRDEAGYVARHAVAELGNGVVGASVVSREPWREPGYYELSVVVEPDARHLGLGLELLQDAERFACEQGARLLAAYVHGADEGSQAFAERRGYRLVQSFVTNELNLADYDAALLAQHVTKAEAAGYRFFNLVELGQTPENHERLYELNKRLAPDLPGNDDNFPTFEQYQHQIIGADWFSPGGQTIATHGTDWVGLVGIGYDADTRIADNTFTAVDRAHRGKGVATALKAKSMEYVASLGALAIRTGNDATNGAILEVNRRMGYRSVPGVRIFHKNV